MYDDFASFAGEELYHGATNMKNDKAFENRMFIYNHRAMIWMSDSVLKKYIDFKNASTKETVDVEKAKKLINAYIEYIKEMRKDSGHANIEISNQDLLFLLTADKILL